MMIQLETFLTISAILFSLGIYIVVARKNAIAILMGVELILNAASINFAAFNKYSVTSTFTGQVFSIFIIVLAACEAVVAFAIVMSMYKNFKDINADTATTMKE